MSFSIEERVYLQSFVNSYNKELSCITDDTLIATVKKILNDINPDDKMAKLKDELKTANSEADKYMQYMNVYQDKCKSLDNQLSELGTEYKSIKSELSKSKECITRLMKLVDESVTDQDHYDLTVKCQQLTMSNEQQNVTITELNNKLEQQDKKIADLQSKLEVQRDNVCKMSEDKNKLILLEKKCSDKDNELTKLQAELDIRTELFKSMLKTNTDVVQLAKDLEENKKLVEKLSNNNNTNNLEKELKETKEQLICCKKSSKEIEDMYIEYREAYYILKDLVLRRFYKYCDVEDIIYKYKYINYI
jgi:chromosome segregation ATPase